MLSPQAADLMRDCRIDSERRGYEKPSDHVPVWIDLAAGTVAAGLEMGTRRAGRVWFR